MMKIKVLLLTLFLLMKFVEHGNTAIKKVAPPKISRPEKWWVLKHLFIAKKSFRLTKTALVLTAELKEKNNTPELVNGGELDAFRHSIWMALLAQHIKVKKVLALGQAHEKGNYLDFRKHRLEEGSLPDKVAGEMDLYNNKVGAVIGNKNKNVSLQVLKSLVINEINSGMMRILLRDSAGNYLTCDSIPIKDNQYKGLWEIPKCLTPSSHLNQ